ncbi:MAG: type II toxin-antitoxin system HicB family antitoxin [Candidatus Sungbacteria bacterium]|uniref:Type II toxin-antitoxin system HicB family antitoxin n=1 Tax=Candidatus Sungiibacteriota bacterium TaxID=2750080 RepID=A0A933DRJ8_9BACT|nr:type II toxin-antitoxin system HicB family antitoxin [Candidatus Sungbacteria bacterium]
MATRKKTYIVKTQYGSFPCIFEPEKDMGGYTAEAPAVQGAVSWGKTLAEAKRMIAEAIEGSIEARAVSKAVKKGTVRVIRRTLSRAAA